MITRNDEKKTVSINVSSNAPKTVSINVKKTVSSNAQRIARYAESSNRKLVSHWVKSYRLAEMDDVCKKRGISKQKFWDVAIASLLKKWAPK